jgi:hypothetical protein
MVLNTKTKKPAPSHYVKKRNGSHQKHSHHFMKTYWPYLPLFVTVGLLVIIAGARVLGITGAIIGSISVALAGISFII